MELNLKELRKRKGMTQEELASAIGATKRRIGAWERGENDIPMDFAVSIADVLDCTVDEIAGRNSKVPVLSLDFDERLLVRLYRNMDEEARQLLIEQAKMYSLACDAKKEADARHVDLAKR